MPSSKLRVGIIGANINYGWGTRAHIPAIKALSELEVVAVCTTRRETAEETARKYDIPLTFTNPEELAAHPDVDIVSVSTRAPTHNELVKLAVKAGKHVFCEWPLGANLAEATEERDLAEAQNVRHMVGLQGRGVPVFNHIKELVAGGYVGEVLSCTMLSSSSGAGRRVPTFTEGVDRAKGVGTLAISGGHSIDTLCFCLGEFKEISAVVATQVKKALVVETGTVLDVTAPDQVSVSGLLAGGAVASVHIKSVPDFGTGFLFEIDGSEGTLVVSSEVSAQIGDPVLRGARKGDKGLEVLPTPDKHRWVPADMPAGPPYNVELYRKFAESIREGSPVEPDFNLAVTRHKMLDAIQRASDTGQTQAL
jgi:predicted dehydrogenase